MSEDNNTFNFDFDKLFGSPAPVEDGPGDVPITPTVLPELPEPPEPPATPPKRPGEIDIGAVNAPSGTPVKPKFVVNFSETGEYSDMGEVDTRQPKRRGSIYFSNGTQRAAIQQQASAEQSAASAPKAKKATSKSGKSAKKQSGTAKTSNKGKAVRQSAGKFFLSFMSVVLICTLIISAIGISCINDVLALNRSEESIMVTVPNDCDTNDIIDILSDYGLIHQKLFCKFFYKVKRAVFNKDKDLTFMDAFKGKGNQPVFLSGVYYVESNLGLEAYINEFQQEQVSESTIRVVFPEGWSIYQMFDKLESFGVCKKSELVMALNGTDFEYDFAQELPENGERVFRLEGYLFPDTYEFFEKSDANSILRKMLENFQDKWSTEYAGRAKELGMTIDEVITLASIIQREAADEDQMAEVSSVLHNRLNNSVSYPTLGCDATLNYIEKYVTPNVSSAEARIYSASYNTAAIAGLPAGPICNPGEAAIKAALYPADTDYFYFCHDNSGKIYLARTNAEHDANLLTVLRKNNG